MPEKTLTLDDVNRYADFEPRAPEAWAKREEEARRHNEHLSAMFPVTKLLEDKKEGTSS